MLAGGAGRWRSVSSCSPSLKTKADLALLPHSCSNTLVTDTFPRISLRKGGSRDLRHSFSSAASLEGRRHWVCTQRVQTQNTPPAQNQSLQTLRVGASVAGVASPLDACLASPWREEHLCSAVLYVRHVFIANWKTARPCTELWSNKLILLPSRKLA